MSTVETDTGWCLKRKKDCQKVNILNLCCIATSGSHFSFNYSVLEFEDFLGFNVGKQL